VTERVTESAKITQRNIRFPGALWEAITRVARRNGRSTNSEIVLALIQHVENNGEQDSGRDSLEALNQRSGRTTPG